MFLEEKALNPGVDTTPAPFTLESLIAWLRTQDADGIYDFNDTTGRRGGCLFFRYGVAQGHSADFGGYLKTIIAFNGGENTSSDPWAEEKLAVSQPHTLGAALARAEAIAEAR